MGDMLDDYERQYPDGLDPRWYYARPTRDTVWATRDGRKVRIRDMADSHLFNAAAFLLKTYGLVHAAARAWRSAFLAELRRRVIGEIGGDGDLTHLTSLTADEMDCVVEQHLADTSADVEDGATNESP